MISIAVGSQTVFLTFVETLILVTFALTFSPTLLFPHRKALYTRDFVYALAVM